MHETRRLPEGVPRLRAVSWATATERSAESSGADLRLTVCRQDTSEPRSDARETTRRQQRAASASRVEGSSRWPWRRSALYVADRGRPSPSACTTVGHVVGRHGGCVCPEAAVRAVPARLLLLCLLLGSSWLTVDGGCGRRRQSAASPGRTGSRGRVGQRGWWRSKPAAVAAPIR
jgi:hypothetical protein